MKARDAALEKDGVLLQQEMLKAQQIAATKDGDTSKYLDEVTKLEILNEVEPLKLQVKLSTCSSQVIKMYGGVVHWIVSIRLLCPL